MMNTLLVAWQDQGNRSWYPVGRLSRHGEGYYEYMYTKGALEARAAGFRFLPGFDDFSEVYRSTELFPVFANRIPPESRPDFADFMAYLNLPRDGIDPIAILSVSGGRRVTDSLELFPIPIAGPDGKYVMRFLVHGIRHLPPASQERILSLTTGECLRIMADLQNPIDPKALALRSDDSPTGGRFLIGFVPRYLLFEAWDSRLVSGLLPTITVERVNPPPAPLQVRLLCKWLAKTAGAETPFASEPYQPISTGAL
jgi:hypothetical protein